MYVMQRNVFVKKKENSTSPVSKTYSFYFNFSNAILPERDSRNFSDQTIVGLEPSASTQVVVSRTSAT